MAEQAPVPGTLVVPSSGERDRRWSPKDGRRVLFGRNPEVVHLCVGGNDLGVSREHGMLICRAGQWWLRNTGKRQVEIDDVRSVGPNEDAEPLPEGFSSIRVHGCDGPHTFEVVVVGRDGWAPVDRSRSSTIPVRGWPLHRRERLAVTAIAQDYLRGDSDPKPRSWGEALASLQTADPDGGWRNNRSVERVVGELRVRMASDGADGLLSGEEKETGDALKRNLIKVLRDSGTIGNRDLALIDRDLDDAAG